MALQHLYLSGHYFTYKLFEKVILTSFSYQKEWIFRICTSFTLPSTAHQYLKETSEEQYKQRCKKIVTMGALIEFWQGF